MSKLQKPYCPIHKKSMYTLPKCECCESWEAYQKVKELGAPYCRVHKKSMYSLPKCECCKNWEIYQKVKAFKKKNDFYISISEQHQRNLMECEHEKKVLENKFALSSKINYGLQRKLRSLENELAAKDTVNELCPGTPNKELEKDYKFQIKSLESSLDNSRKANKVADEIMLDNMNEIKTLQSSLEEYKEFLVASVEDTKFFLKKLDEAIYNFHEMRKDRDLILDKNKKLECKYPKELDEAKKETPMEQSELKSLLLKEIGLLRDIFSESWQETLHKNDFGKLLSNETYKAIKNLDKWKKLVEDAKDMWACICSHPAIKKKCDKCKWLSDFEALKGEKK